MPTLAASADPYRLYELAVQSAAVEAGWLDDCFAALRGRHALTLREDFCGTAALARAWVARRAGNRAVACDVDPKVLAWGRAAALATLAPTAARRLRLVEADLRCPATPPAATGPFDLAVALNFSYWLIPQRGALLDYLRRLRATLAADGVLVLDAFGGSDATRVLTEARVVDDGAAGFTYVWEQAAFDPISGVQQCRIHFAFPDGSRLDRAFEFSWRLWTLPELLEVLTEAGFRRPVCYWQGWDAEGLPDGRFVPTTQGRPDAGWICYLSAEA